MKRKLIKFDDGSFATFEGGDFMNLTITQTTNIDIDDEMTFKSINKDLPNLNKQSNKQLQLSEIKAKHEALAKSPTNSMKPDTIQALADNTATLNARKDNNQ